MKKALLIFFLGLALFSCENREPNPIVVPDWIKPRLQELENSGDCFGCTVQRWTYNDEFFYHVYCGYWSCSDCEIYHYNGDLVVWGEDIDPVDFNANKSRPKIIWECGDDLGTD